MAQEWIRSTIFIKLERNFHRSKSKFWKKKEKKQ